MICDFYIWSNRKADNKFLVKVGKTNALCETLMAKHGEVFDKVILPELITWKSDVTNILSGDLSKEKRSKQKKRGGWVFKQDRAWGLALS